MSILRTEIVGRDPHFSNCYDLLVDDVADLADFPAAGTGSMALVREDGKVYVKADTGEWEEAI